MAFWKGRAIGPSRMGAVGLGLNRVNLGVGHRRLTERSGATGPGRVGSGVGLLGANLGI